MKRYKCLVKKCGHVVRTRTGVATHIKRKHPGVKAIRGETFDTTRDAVTNPNSNGPYKAKKRKRAVPVITAKTEYINMPCMLRISVKGLTVQGLYPVMD